MLPNVRVLIQNGQLGGLIAFAEGVAGAIGTGVSVVGKVQVGTPITVISLADAQSQGITLADNPVAYRHVEEFYSLAATGSELNILLVANTMLQKDMFDYANAAGAVKLINYAQGRIRLMFNWFTPAGGYTLIATHGIDEDVYDAMVNAQVLAKQCADANIPLRILLEGRAFTGTAASLNSLLTLTNNRVAILIGGTAADGTCSTGLAIGAAASLPVQRKISRVKNGSLPIAAAYAGSAEVGVSTQLDSIHDKGFITIRKFGTTGGYYFSSDHMACKDADDYKFLARGRVIDKAQILAYGTYVEEIDDDVNTIAGGKLEPAAIAYLEAKIEKQILTNMAGEISGVSCYIDPNQDVVTSNKLTIQLVIRGKGYLGNLDVLLGFGL